MSFWKCVCFHVQALAKPCCREQRPHIGSGLRAFGRRPAGLGLVFWFFLQTVTVHLVCSPWFPPGGFPVPSSLLFSSSPARRAAPGVFSNFRSPSARIPARRGRGSPGASQAFRRKPSRLQTLERGWGPPGADRGSRRSFPGGNTSSSELGGFSRFPAAGCWGPRCSPQRGGSGRQPIASCLPNLNSWGDKVFVKLGPGPAPAAPLCQQEEGGPL